MLSNNLSEIKTPDVITAEASNTIFEVMNMMAERNVGGIVITENQAPVGIFTEQDVLKRVMTKNLDIRKAPIKKVMTSPIQAVPKETHIIEALGKMYQKRFRHLLVQGKNGAIVGLVSIRDILRFAVDLGQGLTETQTVGSVISGSLNTVEASQSIQEVVELMVKRKIPCVIVLSAAKAKGIFTERDVLKRVAIKDLDPQKNPVKDVMTADFTSMPLSTLIGEVLAEMYQRGFRNMPIRGEKGDLVGVVSLGEVLKYARALDVDELVRKSWKEVEEFWESEEHYTPG
jgi:CBS domain-containing protein